MIKYPLGWAVALPACVFLPLVAHGQLVINDTLTGASSSYNWTSFDGACLTAGNNTGSIPACVGLKYYTDKKSTLVGGITGTLPDVVGQGALRLTNGDTVVGGSNSDSQKGTIMSAFSFPSNQGLQVTFTTSTYGGDGGTGADGMTFFLADAAQTAATGAVGGSLGYSCGNYKTDGVPGAYIGVGIDEYGNFTNGATNISDSVSVNGTTYDITTNKTVGDNTASGVGFKAGSISLRGAGNVNWTWLNKNYPLLYPSSMNHNTAVQNTCKTGTLYNGSKSVQTVTVNGVSTAIPSGYSSRIAILDYPLLATSQLPSKVTISTQRPVSGVTNTPVRDLTNLITYALSISSAGILNLSYSVNKGTAVPVITDKSIIDSNGPLPDKFRFGFSAATGGSSNVHEITCFKATQLNASSTSAGANVQESASVRVGTQVYLAYYHPTNWWGQLSATSLIYSSITDTLAFNSTANWDASCVLTGGACPATDGTNTAQGSGSRTLLTWNGSAGIAFKGASTPTYAQTAVNVGDAAPVNTNRLEYLRGDRTNELTKSLPSTGVFRARTGVLGDIMNSSPTWVGAPALPYKGPWVDAINTSATLPEGTSYATFATNNAARTNVVYVGANDGFLHGFRAGAYKADGTFNTAAANDGLELLGYMPSAALATIHNTTASLLDFPADSYAHNAFVDATPGTGDLYYQGAWHTWLVGGLGAGGNASGVIGNSTATGTGGIYALDITTPGNFSEANASTLVLGDWSSSTLSCLNNSPANCGKNLGNTYGTPIIRRLHDGNWAVIFGNGLNSSTGTAGIYIMTVKQSDGSKSFRFLDTGRGASSGNKNGIAYVASSDLDADHITDYIYAGDILGNLWRFDLTSSSSSNWAADSSPLFSTPTGQPITTKVTVSSTVKKTTNNPRVMISFGTGQKFPQTTITGATYATGTQKLYGIWDWNMSSWNTKSSTQYASLSSPQTVTATELQSQTATKEAGGNSTILGYRSLTKNSICWKGLTNCASGLNTKFGWQLALPDSNEQVIYNPTTSYGMFWVNTTIPAINNVLACDTLPLPTGYTMAVDIETGGAPVNGTSVFSNAASNDYVSTNNAILSGVGLSATGTPSFVTTTKGTNYMINQSVDGTGSATKVVVSAIGAGKRVSWIKLR